MSEEFKWSENTPTLQGFYATHYSWDALEGSFCYSNYFDSKDWRDDRPMFQFAGPFDTEEKADSWCEENDISW
tara:strand:+ start:9205 stop:9423 length:219 start_codon:yes stop_codon:yes gene_type:complete